jgi:cytochrome c biogenesis protein CcmG, thiol:disulfide interchange protein DsbE
MARTGSNNTATADPDVPERRFSRGAIIGTIVAVIAVAAIVAVEAGTQGFAEDGLPQFQEITVEGSALSPFPGMGAADPSVGQTAPSITGSDWEGNELSIEPNGDPSLVVFLTHWCPHCQAEVPVLQDIADAGQIPEGLNTYAVVTGTDESAPNYPPTRWLQGEGWTYPSILDDESSSAATAYGLTSYPYYVVLDGENRVLGRLSGELGEDALLELMNTAAAGESAEDLEGGESSESS